MGLSGASAFFIYLVKSPTMNLVLSCVFGLVSTMGFNALDCLGIGDLVFALIVGGQGEGQDIKCGTTILVVTLNLP